MEQPKRDLWSLTGALFVVLTLIAFFAIGGSTPGGGASAQKVASFYSDHGNKEIFAAVVLALGAVSLLFFSAILKGRFEARLTDRGVLPTVALVGGVVAAGGFLTAATIHFALADYGDNIQPTAAQAVNAIDNDFFLPFAMGLATLVLASSLLIIRTKMLLPTWLGWAGIVVFVISFTPAGFIGFGLAGVWIIIVSILLFLNSDTAAVGNRLCDIS